MAHGQGNRIFKPDQSAICRGRVGDGKHVMVMLRVHIEKVTQRPSASNFSRSRHLTKLTLRDPLREEDEHISSAALLVEAR